MFKPNLELKLLLVFVLAVIIYGMSQQQAAYGAASSMSQLDRPLTALYFSSTTNKGTSYE